jgi:CRP-like cAMP-binding protein
VRRAGLDAKLADLAALRVGADATADELRALGRLVDKVDLSSGHVLLRDGDTISECFILESGTALAYQADRVVDVLGRDDHVGVFEAMTGSPAITTVVSLTPVIGLVLDRRDVLDALRCCPSLSRAMIVGLASRLRRLQDCRAGRSDSPASRLTRGSWTRATGHSS